MNTPRARFTQYWPDIILSVVSIIQGLAFNNLVLLFPKILDYTLQTGDSLPLIHFVLSFVILLRVFQTYIVAAIDYTDWSANFFDLSVIFTIGGIEYYVFSTLIVPGFKVEEFHRNLSALTILGIIGYIGAILRLKESFFNSYEKYRREVHLQVVNVIGLALLQIVSLIVILAPLSHRADAGLGLAGTAITMFSIYYSLSRSFANQPRIPAVPTITNPSTEATDSPRDDTPIITRAAERENALTLCGLLMASFPEYYSNLFDTSIRLTERILYRVLVARRGLHRFGYRNYELAFNANTGKCIGLICIVPGVHLTALERISGSIWMNMIVLRFLGITGLLRFQRNLRRQNRAESHPREGETLIRQIAVAAEHSRKGVGGSLLEFARAAAKSQGKTAILLDVPANSLAVPFLIREGFKPTVAISALSDEGQSQEGDIVRMTMPV